MKLLIILTILPDAIENDRRDFNQRVPVAIKYEQIILKLILKVVHCIKIHFYYQAV